MPNGLRLPQLGLLVSFLKSRNGPRSYETLEEALEDLRSARQTVQPNAILPTSRPVVTGSSISLIRYRLNYSLEKGEGGHILVQAEVHANISIELVVNGAYLEISGTEPAGGVSMNIDVEFKQLGVVVLKKVVGYLIGGKDYFLQLRRDRATREQLEQLESALCTSYLMREVQTTSFDGLPPPDKIIQETNKELERLAAVIHRYEQFVPITQ